MQRTIPRLLISAVGSGTGKTTVTAALLSALCARGMRVQSLKCGPDYIDPMFHSHITGRPAYHADPFFLSRFSMRELVSRVSADADCTIFEGAMGYYDGIGGTEQASAYTVSDWLELPTLLVANPQGMGCSIAAVCRGFQTFRTPNPICGILLNGVRRGMAAYYREILERETGLPVLGCLPQLSEVQLESRHLGLMTAGEVSRLDEKVRFLGKTAEETMQLDQILELARKAPPLPEVPLLSKPQPSFRLGIAQDRAFCFYYAENLELLEHYGAELVPFSPLEDAALAAVIRNCTCPSLAATCCFWNPCGRQPKLVSRSGENAAAFCTCSSLWLEKTAYAIPWRDCCPEMHHWENAFAGSGMSR